MRYDIASKRLMEFGAKDILRDIAGLDLADYESVQETGQETFDLKRCDYAALCRTTSGEEVCAVVEYMTRWSEEKRLDMMLYALHHRRKHRLRVVPIMLLFLPDARASGDYADECLQGQFKLVKLWELPLHLLLHPEKPWLWPFAALSDEGVAQVERIDSLIYESQLLRREKSDLLTILTTFLSLKSAPLAKKLLDRRRELMIDSPFYEWIKKEGIAEGEARGEARGEAKSRLEERRLSLWTVLDERFHPQADEFKNRVMAITDPEELSHLMRSALRVRSLEEFAALLA